MSVLFKNEYEKRVVIENLLSKLESGDITEEKLHRFIDYEISKPESEMDTELIDLCTSTLCKLYGKIDVFINKNIFINKHTYPCMVITPKFSVKKFYRRI